MAQPPTPSRREALAALSGAAALSAADARAEPDSMATTPDAAGIDDLVGRFMRDFGIPGMAVAIVQPGQAVFLRGYGVRALGQPAQWVTLHPPPDLEPAAGSFPPPVAGTR